eukprot:GHVQ01011822.1.p1 GENE.GHVQ01011822.1~~GHVQ01011822.1.p1  ORF type:complete len:106 (-),score=8.44 GHVQ01011822.1:27-344(-)
MWGIVPLGQRLYFTELFAMGGLLLSYTVEALRANIKTQSIRVYMEYLVVFVQGVTLVSVVLDLVFEVVVQAYALLARAHKSKGTGDGEESEGSVCSRHTFRTSLC